MPVQNFEHTTQADSGALQTPEVVISIPAIDNRGAPHLSPGADRVFQRQAAGSFAAAGVTTVATMAGLVLSSVPLLTLGAIGAIGVVISAVAARDRLAHLSKRQLPVPPPTPPQVVVPPPVLPTLTPPDRPTQRAG